MRTRVIGVLFLALSLVTASLAAGQAFAAVAAPPGPSDGTRAPQWDGAAYRSITGNVSAHRPGFPGRRCTVTDDRYAPLVTQAVDGQGSAAQQTVWYYGDAINAAIEACHESGGGTVVIPAEGSRNGGGVYYSGAINLLSNVNLYVASGATIKFVRNFTNQYYPLALTSYQGIDLYDYSPLVYALNQTNIAVTGGGTLDAQFNVSPWQPPAPLPGAPAGTWQALSQMNNDGLPVSQRIFTDDGHMPAQIPVLQGCPPQSRDWGPCAAVRYVTPPAGTVAYQSTFAPQFVEFNHSSDVLVQGIHLVNTQFWEIHPLNSQNVTVSGVSIDDTAHHTDDGIDPESSRDVVIQGNDITVLDDGIAVKSGRNRDGRELRAPSENIVIDGNHFTNPAGGGSAAFSVGSEMSGGVANVFARDNVAAGAGLAYLLKLKTNSYRGGAIQGVYLRDDTIDQTIRGLVNFDTNYSESAAQPDGDIFNPVIRDVYLGNVNAAPSVSTSYPAFVSATQSRSPVQDVVYENSTFYTTSPFEAAFSGSGQFFAGLRIKNVTFTDPVTHAAHVYNSVPVNLAGPTVAHAGATAVLLHSEGSCQPGYVNQVPAQTFTVTGTVADYGQLQPAVQVFLDRSRTPVSVTVSPDGSFQAGPITLDDTQYWYRGSHYLSVNLRTGIDVNTVVYQVTTAGPGPGAPPAPGCSPGQ